MRASSFMIAMRSPRLIASMRRSSSDSDASQALGARRANDVASFVKTCELSPPVIRTCPFGNSVAGCPLRAWIRLPVGEKVPLDGA